MEGRHAQLLRWDDGCGHRGPVRATARRSLQQDSSECMTGEFSRRLAAVDASRQPGRTWRWRRPPARLALTAASAGKRRGLAGAMPSLATLSPSAASASRSDAEPSDALTVGASWACGWGLLASSEALAPSRSAPPGPAAGASLPRARPWRSRSRRLLGMRPAPPCIERDRGWRTPRPCTSRGLSSSRNYGAVTGIMAVDIAAHCPAELALRPCPREARLRRGATTLPWASRPWASRSWAPRRATSPDCPWSRASRVARLCQGDALDFAAHWLCDCTSRGAHPCRGTVTRSRSGYLGWTRPWPCDAPARRQATTAHRSSPRAPAPTGRRPGSAGGGDANPKPSPSTCHQLAARSPPSDGHGVLAG